MMQLLEHNVILGYKVMTNIARVAANSVAQMNMQVSNCNAVFDLYAANSKRPRESRPAGMR